MGACVSSLRVRLEPPFSIFPRALVAASLVVSPAAGFAQDLSPRDRDKPWPVPNYHVLTETPSRDAAIQNFRFRVKVKGGDRLLWSGDMWLGEYDGARFDTDLQDINP